MEGNSTRTQLRAEAQQRSETQLRLRPKPRSRVRSRSKLDPGLLAAFILLSAATILLLVVSIQFYTSASVWPQMKAWARQMTPSMIVLNMARMALLEQPQPPSAPMIPVSGAILTATPTATPFQPLPSDTQPAPTQPAPTLVPPTQVPVYQVVEEQPPQGSLVVPSLSIDQPLVPVAVRDQVWDVSELGAQVGWLQTTGSRPGDDLAMVLVGHITLPPPGGPGPFLYLNSLKPGDLVEYRTEQETYIYLVVGKDEVSPDNVTSLYRANGSSLLLVTCTGYNALERKYDRRLVIEAELVGMVD